MVLTDTHAHLYLEQFDKDRGEVMERVSASGVSKICLPNIDHSSIDSMLQMEMDYEGVCFAAMGLHPCSVKKDFEKELYLVEDWLNKKKFIAVGEIGTDLYWDKTFQEQQEEAFKIQVEWAKKHQLPIIIHCRESIDWTIDLVETLMDDHLTGVFHCFSGNEAQAKRIEQLGFYMGIGGVATFKNGGMDKVIPNLPLQRLLIETDSPYLSPVPHRGKRNESAYVALVAQRIADLKEIELEEVARATTSNASNLFGW